MCCSWSLRKSFKSSTIECDICWRFFIYEFYYFPPIPVHLFIFLKGCDFYQIVFLYQLGWLCGLIFPHSVNVVCWLINFCVLKHLCISGISPTWSWYIIIPIYCWISSASTLLRIFSSIHEIYCSVVAFSFAFFWLWQQGNIGFRDWVRKGSLLFKYLEKFEKNWYWFLFSLICFTK